MLQNEQQSILNYYLRYFSNEVHQKDTISRILWYSDWLHNITSANLNTTSGGISIM